MRIAIGLVAAAAIGACNVVSPAQADWGNGYRAWHPHDGWDRPGGSPALIVAPRPPNDTSPAAYYVVPGAASVPPPVADPPPPPTYDVPGISLGLTGH